MKVLSLGAGRQSSTIFLMSCYGEIEKIDAAVFADTWWESKAVYKWLEFLISEGKEHGIQVHVVSGGNIKEDAIISQIRGIKTEGNRWASMPYFVLGPNGEKGMIRRQCTYEYKIRVLEKKFRELAGYKPYDRIPIGEVEVWKGISTDEIRRMSIAKTRWIEFYYPLIELGMSAQDCLEWCENRGLYPPRSACIGCPYHSKMEWRNMRDNAPDEWQEAVEFDKAIRNCGGMRGQVFLHTDRVPLDEVDLSIPDDYQEQLGMFRDECQGICGV
jgi:hypothetical protein